MPTVSSHLPDNWKLTDVFSAKVSRDYRGKPGRYLLDLLERDLTGTAEIPEATDSNILIDLAKRLRPELAESLATQLATLECTQPLLLAKMIEALEETLSDATAVPRTPRPKVSIKLYHHSLTNIENEPKTTYVKSREDTLRDPICPARSREAVERAAEIAGYSKKRPWPVDALRHTFATYHLAAFADPGKTALLLGHEGNPTMLYQHYRGLATKADAEKFWAIRP